MDRDPRDVLLEAVERILEVRATELAPALTQAADVVLEACRAEKVDVFLHEASSESLVAVGTSTTPLARKQRALGLDRLPLANGGRAVEVYRAGEPFLTGRLDEDDDELSGIVGPLGIRSAALAPIDMVGTRRGVLGVASTVPNAFTDHHLRLVRVFARWVGLVAHAAESVEQLAAAAKEHGRRSAAEELVTVVAHDLRNFIGPIHGRVHLLRERATREGRAADRRDAEAAARSVGRLTRVLSDLLDVGRIEQGLFDVQRIPLDLCALVRETAAAVEAPGHEIALDGPCEVLVDGDPVKLRQAFENILSNSVKHAPGGTSVRVTIRLDDAGREASVAIADQGPGMDAALASRIFTRFARGPGSQGLGLGLYLARQIAVAHGGSLEVATATGRGTTFTLRLPAHDG